MVSVWLDICSQYDLERRGPACAALVFAVWTGNFLSEFVGVCRSLSEFVDNISLRSVYDTAKRTCGGDMLTAEGAVGRVCRSLYNSLLEFVGVCRSLNNSLS